MSFLKGTKLYSIFTGKCPVCHESKMYTQKNPYKLSETLKMHERCSNCQTKYKIEPSFFYGAMYVSYGVGIAFAVAAFVISFLLFGLDKTYAFIAIITTLVVFLPVILRLSRNIWINFFFNYEREKVETK
ncbi:MAG: DUF983 domain-containing protein [Flavobacteriaceae bacterium]|nr:DUF983 domain-containing protein [Flavobacteriaceae bacterium]